MLGDINLKDHFLSKLDELRYMRDAYYGVPEMPKVDPLEILSQRQKDAEYF